MRLKTLKIPFGFKANLWKKQPLPVGEIVRIDAAGFGANPVDVLGTRDDSYEQKNFMTFQKKWLLKVLQF